MHEKDCARVQYEKLRRKMIPSLSYCIERFQNSFLLVHKLKLCNIFKSTLFLSLFQSPAYKDSPVQVNCGMPETSNYRVTTSTSTTLTIIQQLYKYKKSAALKNLTT